MLPQIEDFGFAGRGLRAHGSPNQNKYICISYINRLLATLTRYTSRAAALPQAVFDLPRAAFNLVPPLEGIPTNSRLLHRGYGPQLKLVIMLQYPLSRRQPRYAGGKSKISNATRASNRRFWLRRWGVRNQRLSSSSISKFKWKRFAIALVPPRGGLISKITISR